MVEKWMGYKLQKVIFEEHEGIVVFPNDSHSNGYLAVKTEYWGEFPEAVELPLLERGFHLCYIKNNNRWGTEQDIDRKARFIRFVQNEYGLNNKCILIGMSCGGLIAIKLAARYPERIKCMYLDAPVINYMSCPCGFGVGKPLSEDNSEILNALGLESISELLAYREMPLDKLGELVKHKIPVIMVVGGSDSIVPYCENGIFLEQAYKKEGIEIEVYIKPEGEHHPHGLMNSTVITEFIVRHCE